ncbi:MAG: hypothetical protein QOE36_389 [Gaiellaceae bacterium]|nr:hypothetical protein [Gaiellaceae bacterium]
MTPTGHGSTVVELPNDRDVLITRQFEAPIALVFDVLTKPEHVSKWFAGPGEEMKECSIDLRVGGDYHFVFLTEDGIEMSFRGTYLEVEPPTRTVATWLFEGRPGGDAVESQDLHEAHGVTTLTVKLAFSDAAGRPTRFEGMQESFDRIDDVVRSLLDPKAAVSR